MLSTRTKLRRKVKAASRTVRGVGKILGALVSTDHPLLAHIIPMRRCNLACKYCNEYDDCFEAGAARDHVQARRQAG